jgi:hypothetical protein
MGTEIQTDDPRYVRDFNSKALLSTDHYALQSHRRERLYFKRQQDDINIMKTQIEQLTKLSDEVIEIKTLLQEIVRK